MARIFPDSAYVQGLPINGDLTGVAAQTYMRSLDQAQANAVNGDAGGTWNPSTFITIAGAGMWCCGPWIIGAAAGDNIVATPSVAITHGDGDYDQLQAGNGNQSQSIVTAFGDGADVSGGAGLMLYSWLPAGMQANGYAAATNAAPVGVPRAILPLRVHDGATFASATITFSVKQSHSGVPASLPMFRVYRVDVLGNVTALFTTGTIAGGYVQFAAPGSGAAWYNSGNPQTLLLTCDASITVDRTKYAYFAEVIDENGANALGGNQYLAVKCAFTGIPDLRPD
jgi:hypothetical protein